MKAQITMKKKGIKLDPISLDQWMEQLKYQEEYSNFYNKLAIKQRGIEAVSHLSNTKSEIINLSEEAKREVMHYLKIYKKFFQISEDDSKQVKEIYRKIMKFIEIEFLSRSKGGLYHFTPIF